MEHEAVKSSNVASIAYDADQRALEVRFLNGGIYRYDGVTRDEWNALRRADSIGSHLHQHIKSRYTGVKVDDGQG